MATWGGALKSLTISLDGVRLVLDDLAREATTKRRRAGFFARREVILSSLIVTISGYFEAFLIEFAQEFTSTLSAKQVPFSKLPPKIQMTHFKVGGRVLSEACKTKPRPPVGATREDVASRLASVSGGSYDLLWEAFADTRSNPGSEAIKGYLSAMAVVNGFNEIAAYLTAKDPNQPQSATVLSRSLDALIERRNECAHSGASSQLLDEVTVREYCELIERMATGIAGAVDRVIQAA
jgi:hypothetical protein